MIDYNTGDLLLYLIHLLAHGVDIQYRRKKWYYKCLNHDACQITCHMLMLLIRNAYIGQGEFWMNF